MNRNFPERLLELIEESQVLIIVGEPGSGKSVIAKRAIERAVKSESLPAFAFRVEEFDAQHIDQALVAMGVPDTVPTLSAKFSLLPAKLLFIDSVERLFEMVSTAAFTDLMSLLQADRTWRLILCCRVQAVSPLVNYFISPLGLSVTTFDVPKLTNEELEEVATRIPRIKPLLLNPRIYEILRTPFYLRIVSSSALDLTSFESTRATQIEFRRFLWREAVARPREKGAGLPSRRMEAFVQLSVRRARNMLPYVTADDIDAEAMERLVDDGLIVSDGHRLYTPADDLMEDWALFEHVERCFSDSTEGWAAFLSSIGAEPAIKRTFRLWLSEAAHDSSNRRLRDFLLDAARDSTIAQHWRDDVVVAGLLSEAAEDFIGMLGEELLLQNKQLLKRCIHLLRTACKGPNEKFIALIGKKQQGYLGQFLSLSFSKPIGGGWAAIIRFIGEHETAFSFEESQLIAGLLSDWSQNLDLSTDLPAEATYCAQLALKYFMLLSEKDVYAERLEKQYLTILFRAVPESFDSR